MPLLIPIGDNNEGRTIVPWATYSLMVVTALIFFVFQRGPSGERFTNRFSVFPFEFLSEAVVDKNSDEALLEDYHPGVSQNVSPTALSLVTSMFLHGGVWHLLGNLLFLWVVGDNVEDEMGHFKFLLFYVTCGILAGLAHVLTNMHPPNSLQPMLGASGAIAGVMGAYLLKHPTRSIYVFLYRIILPLPAWIAVGAWFLLQLFGGLGGFGPDGDGVAYMAHIGGFLAGLLLVNLFANPRKLEDHLTREAIVQHYRHDHPRERGAGL